MRVEDVRCCSYKPSGTKEDIDISLVGSKKFEVGWFFIANEKYGTPALARKSRSPLAHNAYREKYLISPLPRWSSGSKSSSSRASDQATFAAHFPCARTSDLICSSDLLVWSDQSDSSAQSAHLLYFFYFFALLKCYELPPFVTNFHRPVHWKGWKFFLKNFFLWKSDWGRRSSRGY